MVDTSSLLFVFCLWLNPIAIYFLHTLFFIPFSQSWVACIKCLRLVRGISAYLNHNCNGKRGMYLSDHPPLVSPPPLPPFTSISGKPTVALSDHPPDVSQPPPSLLYHQSQAITPWGARQNPTSGRYQPVCIDSLNTFHVYLYTFLSHHDNCRMGGGRVNAGAFVGLSRDNMGATITEVTKTLEQIDYYHHQNYPVNSFSACIPTLPVFLSLHDADPTWQSQIKNDWLSLYFLFFLIILSQGSALSVWPKAEGERSWTSSAPAAPLPNPPPHH